ncbi:MAG: PTS system mannose/fructose/sorbose family transporter subunit IID [Gemmatimonadales bacterium]
MRPELRSFGRLLTIQASWNYERMSGIGLGYACEPLLGDLAASDPARSGEAVLRAAGFFNSHPYLAGVAAGAETRAEYDGVDGKQIERLRAALCSPLGALGDQLFWAGLWPVVLGAALIAVVFGAEWWAPVAAVAIMLLVRVWVTRWALRTGLRSGIQVGVALQNARIRAWIPAAGLTAAFVIGAAVPLVVGAEDGVRGGPGVLAVVVALVGLAVGQRKSVRFTGVGFGLTVLVAAALVSLVVG